MAGASFTQIILNAAEATGDGDVVDLSEFDVVDAYVQVEGITTATVLIKGSIDGTTYYDISFQDIDNVANLTYIASFTADGLGKLLIVPKYIKLNVSSYTGGTITGTLFVRHR